VYSNKSVSDPYSFDLDPDPASWAEYRSGSGPDTILIQGLKKCTAEKKFKIFLKSKIAIYLSLGLNKGRPSNRRSLQLSKENIQLFKT
jgi:hypothetical protein